MNPFDLIENNKPKINIPFRLPEKCTNLIKRDLRTFHGLFEKNKCQAEYLEELFYRSLVMDDNFGEYVYWDCGSHSKKADIIIEHFYGNLHISIKSGIIDYKKRENQEYMNFSGFRLGRYNGDLGKMIEFLRTNEENMIIAVPTKKIKKRGHIYYLTYIEKETIQYPPKDEWTRNGENGKQTFRCKTENGIEMTIRESMSWQIWWKIPVNLINKKEFYRNF